MKSFKWFFSSRKAKEYKKYYYKNLFPLFDINDVIERSKKCENIYTTDRTIALRTSINFFDSTEKVLTHLENPKCQIYNLNNKYKVLFYKQKINSLKIKLQLHFINDKLFYAAQFFSELNELKQNELFNLIKNKYNIENNNKEINIPFIIKDKFGNILFVENYFHVILNYITGSSDLIPIITEKLPEKQKQKYISVNLNKYI